MQTYKRMVYRYEDEMDNYERRFPKNDAYVEKMQAILSAYPIIGVPREPTAVTGTYMYVGFEGKGEGGAGYRGDLDIWAHVEIMQAIWSTTPFMLEPRHRVSSSISWGTVENVTVFRMREGHIEEGRGLDICRDRIRGKLIYFWQRWRQTD